MFETYILPGLIFGGTGLFAGILLTICSKIFYVKTDERVEAVSNALPQVNCGSCGFSGCSDYASAVVSGKAPANLCKPGGAECAAKISEIMGIETGEVIPQAAVVKCSGDCNATESKFIFSGVQSCLAANRFYNGSEVCTHGCLGFGDCAAVCPNGAINITDRLAKVDRSKCIGCGLCVKACPNSLIELRNITSHVEVLCSSTDIGKITRTVCKSGCIGCKKCEKACENGAITVQNNHAVIDHSKCTNCGKCAEGCPVHVIKKCSEM